jgi:hypothetical protein
MKEVQHKVEVKDQLHAKKYSQQPYQEIKLSPLLSDYQPSLKMMLISENETLHSEQCPALFHCML